MEKPSKTGLGGTAGRSGGKARRKPGGPTLREPEADDVKRIVLDYLSHHCFLSTARALSKQSASPSQAVASPRQAIASDAPSSAASSSRMPPPPPSSKSTGPDLEAEDGEDVQMMSDSVVLAAGGRPSAAAARGPEPYLIGDEGMAVDLDGNAQSSAYHRQPSVKSTINGVGLHPSNGESLSYGLRNGSNEINEQEAGASSHRPPGFRLNPSLQVNGKSPGSSSFESVNSLYAGALSMAELDAIEQRGLIRAEILQGNIQPAIALINSYFPTFFTPVEDGPSADPAESYTSPLFSKPLSTASTTGFNSSPGSSSQAPTLVKQEGLSSSSTTTSHSPPPRIARPLPFISARPAFLHLNLLIQAFVETIRTVPVGPPASAFVAASPTSPAAPPPGNGALTAASSPASSVHSASSAVSATSSTALAQAKALYLSIDQLEEGPSKEWYQSEVRGAASLLAYVPPERAEHPETRAYLAFVRREALADQVNSALLLHAGHYGAPTLDVLSRQATFVWDRLAQHKVDPVPPWSASDGVEWERLGKYFREHRRFDLAEYLAS